ncbi:unnamed protein product [Parnassius mnemosyne]|uniref:C2H2-type domain-containing protein n=1 Tax=Parnassius mnemosyne TaxID=213953 RepID=A0AAV1KZM7_9NEOP
MSVNISEANIEVDVVRLDSDIIDEHLRSSTAVLHDILNDEKEQSAENGGRACSQCGKLYKNANTLHMHFMLKHPEDKIEVQCTSCNKKYSSLLSLQKHVRYMHRYSHRCKACYRTFASSEILEQHGANCSKADTPCTVCGKIFNSKLALRNHLKYKHPETKKYCCHVCSRSFVSDRGLSNHMASIHPPGATECNWCEKVFNSTPALQSHILHKHTQDGVRCIQCPKLFTSKISLGRHLIKVHGRTELNYFCAVCNDRFFNSSNLVSHVIQKHSSDKIPKI